ncbi:MAG: putative manganese transporter [Candidatus Thermoplasmatota archaeon]|nr:putative manganese transporter [Candidatus Thermoplasmatota archaeon]
MTTSSEVIDIILRSMRDAFLAVTVFVAAMVLLFSWLQYVTAGRFVDWIRSKTKLQPIIGALMGLTPGCGGAIVMMPLYARGYVSYGTVVATLIATLGDSAFVLIGGAIANPDLIVPVLLVHLISFIVGVVWGLGIDFMRITPSSPLGRFAPEIEEEITHNISDEKYDVRDELPREEPDGFSYRVVHQGYLIWWCVTLVGLVFAILLLYWGAIDGGPTLDLDDGGLNLDPTTLGGFISWVGLLGTLLSVAIFLGQRSIFGDDTEASIGDKLDSFKETTIHAASETSFVTFWVLIAYFVFEFSILFGGVDESNLVAYGAGVGAIFVAALVGVIPGCGPQIIIMTSYVEGILGFPGLVSNAISQDGDALFPLLVRHRTASLWATFHTVLPAIITGLILMI